MRTDDPLWRVRLALLLTGACFFVGNADQCAQARAPIEGLERSRVAAPDALEAHPLQEPTPTANTPTAEQGETETSEDPEPAPSTLLPGAWHQAGPVTAEYLYTGEGFHQSRGGLNDHRATRYRGNFDLTLTLDTGAANLWEHGEVFVYLQHAQGTTLSHNFVGDGQNYSNIDTSPKPQDLTQLGEYWYRHAFQDGQTNVKIGRQDANADFAFADLGGDFVNSSFSTLPNIPMPYWAFQSLGVSAQSQLNSQWRLGGGAYDQGRDIAQWWSNTVERGVFFIGQADWLPNADCEDALLTQIRYGAWYMTSDTFSVSGEAVYEGNYGLYLTVDRMLWTECDAPEQGCGAFVQVSWCPSDRNQVDRHVGAGVIYRGLLEGRDTDTLGAGYSIILFSSELRALTDQTSESAIEVFYKARLREWFAVQPDVQYIVAPSGQSPDALLVGLRCELMF